MQLDPFKVAAGKNFEHATTEIIQMTIKLWLKSCKKKRIKKIGICTVFNLNIMF